MPRRRPRFSDLERQARDAGYVAEANSRLAGFINFKKGINKIEVKNKVSAADRKRYAYAILPFGIILPAAPTITDRYQAPITQHSNAGRRTLNLSDAQCGYIDMVVGVHREGNFYPAIIRPVVVNPTPVNRDATPLSGVTKKNYKRSYVGKSYGIPFGRTITDIPNATMQNVGEQTVRDTLATKVKAVTAANVKTISFLPEEFKSPGQELVSPAAPPTT